MALFCPQYLSLLSQEVLTPSNVGVDKAKVMWDRGLRTSPRLLFFLLNYWPTGICHRYKSPAGKNHCTVNWCYHYVTSDSGISCNHRSPTWPKVPRYLLWALSCPLSHVSIYRLNGQTQGHTSALLVEYKQLVLRHGLVLRITCRVHTRGATCSPGMVPSRISGCPNWAFSPA